TGHPGRTPGRCALHRDHRFFVLGARRSLASGAARDMTADVYAGDDDLKHAARIRPVATRFRYRIECDAEADALIRICNQLNFANAAPWRLELVTTGSGQL